MGDVRLLALKIQAKSQELVVAAGALVEQLESEPVTWRLPVGNEQYPSAMWYAYTLHDLTGRRNLDRYAHSGLDLNLDKTPWGNVDVGEPVYAVTDGEIIDVGFSDRYRGGIVLKVDHFGVPLFVRYWHLMNDPLFANWQMHETISAGQQIGLIDHYPNGYAHCHFDMAWQAFSADWWFTRHKDIEWANPTYILKTHIDHSQVDTMLERGT